MKISSYNHNYADNNVKNICFRAGDTRLYTDFDGTYFPFPQDAVTLNDKETVSKANDMYSGFRNFTDKAKKKFEILITTGRSKLEMIGALKDLKKSNVDIVMPVGYVFRDGTEEVDKLNESDFDNVSGFDKPKELEDLKNIIRDIDDEVTILEPDVSQFIYSCKSTTPEDLFKELPSDKREKYVSVVTEENGLIELSFPPTMDTKPYSEKFEKYYKQKHIDADIKSYNNSNSMWLPVQDSNEPNDYIFKPSNYIIIKPVKNGVIPDKLNQPKDRIRDILQNNKNDLVIVAGDGSNDKNMLNPFNYIDVLGVEADKNKSVDELLADENVVSALQKLPLAVIVTGNRECLHNITEMKDKLDKKGIKKIFLAKNPNKDFIEKIKLSMLSHSDENEKYKYKLGFELYKEILN